MNFNIIPLFDRRTQFGVGGDRRTSIISIAQEAPTVRQDWCPAHLRVAYEVSQRRVCATLGADRTSVRYRSSLPEDAACGHARVNRPPFAGGSGAAHAGQARRHHHEAHEAARLYREEGSRCADAAAANVRAAQATVELTARSQSALEAWTSYRIAVVLCDRCHSPPAICELLHARIARVNSEHRSMMQVVLHLLPRTGMPTAMRTITATS